MKKEEASKKEEEQKKEEEKKKSDEDAKAKAANELTEKTAEAAKTQVHHGHGGIKEKIEKAKEEGQKEVKKVEEESKKAQHKEHHEKKRAKRHEHKQAKKEKRAKHKAEKHSKHTVKEAAKKAKEEAEKEAKKDTCGCHANEGWCTKCGGGCKQGCHTDVHEASHCENHHLHHTQEDACGCKSHEGWSSEHSCCKEGCQTNSHEASKCHEGHHHHEEQHEDACGCKGPEGWSSKEKCCKGGCHTNSHEASQCHDAHHHQGSHDEHYHVDGNEVKIEGADGMPESTIMDAIKKADPGLFKADEQGEQTWSQFDQMDRDQNNVIDFDEFKRARATSMKDIGGPATLAANPNAGRRLLEVALPEGWSNIPRERMQKVDGEVAQCVQARSRGTCPSVGMTKAWWSRAGLV